VCGPGGAGGNRGVTVGRKWVANRRKKEAVKHIEWFCELGRGQRKKRERARGCADGFGRRPNKGKKWG